MPCTALALVPYAVPLLAQRDPDVSPSFGQSSSPARRREAGSDWAVVTPMGAACTVDARSRLGAAVPQVFAARRDGPAAALCGRLGFGVLAAGVEGTVAQS